MLDLVIVRGIFVLVLTISAFALHPFHTSPIAAAAGGILFGGCIIFFEMRLEQVSLKRLIGAAFGSILGIVGAFLMSLVLSKASPEPFLQVCLLLLMLAMFPANVYAARMPDPPRSMTTRLSLRTAIEAVFLAAAIAVAVGSS